MSSSFPDQSDPEIRIKTLILKSDQKWSRWIWSICRYWSENGSKRSKLDQKWPSKDQNKMILKSDQKWSWWIWSICRYWSENGSKRSKLDHKWPLKDQNKMIRKTTRIFDPGFLSVYKRLKWHMEPFFPLSRNVVHTRVVLLRFSRRINA